jgi:hypothetical protein
LTIFVKFNISYFIKSQKILLFRDAAETLNISVHFEKGTFWLTQKAMSMLFGVERSVVAKHLKNILETKELEENSVCAKFAHTADTTYLRRN